MSPQRFGRAAIATCLAGLPTLFAGAAVAQGKGVVLVASGDWVATEQRDSPTAPPYLCSAFTRKAGRMFAIQANIVDTEARFADPTWSQPASVPGTLAIDVGAYSATLKVTDNTNNVAIAAITPDQLRFMIGAMEKSNAMTVTPGPAAPDTLSLRGSNRATDAFRACAAQLSAGHNGAPPPLQ
jgi:hypothetical protein